MVFIIFNRPEVTKRVFESIRSARPPRLLVVADGPRQDRPDEVRQCSEVRRLVLDGVDWPCRVETDLSERNLGCGRRIFTGLQWAFARVEEAIILEDDCAPDPSFFPFCSAMLARHRTDLRIRMVAGTNFRGARPEAANRCLFSRHTTIWGWATWRRALEGYSLDTSWWRSVVRPKDLRPLCASWAEFRFVCELLDSQHFGAVDTWDIQWFAHVFRQRGLSVVPGTNLISNLGIEGSHTSRRGRNHLLPTSPVRFPIEAGDPVRDEEYDRELVAAHRPPGGWMLGHLAARALRSRSGPLIRHAWRRCRAVKEGIGGVKPQQ